MAEDNDTALLILHAILKMSDNVKACGGTTCISGIAAAHKMQESIQKNKPRILSAIRKRQTELGEG